MPTERNGKVLGTCKIQGMSSRIVVMKCQGGIIMAKRVDLAAASGGVNNVISGFIKNMQKAGIVDVDAYLYSLAEVHGNGIINQAHTKTMGHLFAGMFTRYQDATRPGLYRCWPTYTGATYEQAVLWAKKMQLIPLRYKGVLGDDDHLVDVTSSSRVKTLNGTSAFMAFGDPQFSPEQAKSLLVYWGAEQALHSVQGGKGNMVMPTRPATPVELIEEVRALGFAPISGNGFGYSVQREDLLYQIPATFLIPEEEGGKYCQQTRSECTWFRPEELLPITTIIPIVRL
jgi:hypothetical protein